MRTTDAAPSDSIQAKREAYRSKYDAEEAEARLDRIAESRPPDPKAKKIVHAPHTLLPQKCNACVDT